MLIRSKRRLLSLALVLFAFAGAALPASAAAHRRSVHEHHVHHSLGIPQHNGGDRDSDNNGGPSDGDGNI